MRSAPATGCQGSHHRDGQHHRRAGRRRVRRRQLTRLGAGAGARSSCAEVFRDRFLQILGALPQEHRALPGLAGAHPAWAGSCWRSCAACPGRCSSPSVRPSTIYIDVMRGVPSILVIFLLGFGIPALRIDGHDDRPLVLGRRGPHAHLERLRGRGLPRGHRLGPPEPGRGGALAGPVGRPVDALRRAAAGGAPRHPAAPERLDRPHEGHRAGLVHRRRRGLPPRPDHPGCRRSTSRPTSSRPSSSCCSPSPWRASSTGSWHATGGASWRARPMSPAAVGGSGRRLGREAVRIEGLLQVVRRARGAQGHRPRRGRARGRLPHRRVGVGQVDAAALHQPARAHRGWPDHRGGRGDHRSRRDDRQRSGAASASSSRPTTCSRT